MTYVYDTNRYTATLSQSRLVELALALALTQLLAHTNAAERETRFSEELHKHRHIC